MNYRDKLREKSIIVVKIGTSTLSYPNGRLNLQRIEKLVCALSKLRKQGKKLILVSSGAIGVGAGRLSLNKKPEELAYKQALAAVGQAELIKIYQKFFESQNQIVAQVLLTKDVTTDTEKNKNATNTLLSLLDMSIIPIINENDTISTDEIEFGDNDTLSAYVASLVKADLLVMLSDIDGLYSSDPKRNPTAKIISTVETITPDIEKIASGAGTSFGTGGMVTKILAAKICNGSGIDSMIVNGGNPKILFEILDGKEIGTLFVAPKQGIGHLN